MIIYRCSKTKGGISMRNDGCGCSGCGCGCLPFIILAVLSLFAIIFLPAYVFFY